MTRLQRATLKAAAFILATLGATGALVAAGLNESTPDAALVGCGAAPACDAGAMK